MKRLFSFILIAALLLTILPSALADEAEPRLIALTFDDGPSAYTEELLDGLKARGARVTFFCVGYKISGNADIIKRAWLEGHQIASHTWNHPEMTSISDAEIKSQLSRVEAAFNDALGFKQDYILRPPYGSCSQRVLNAANVPAIYWSMNTADYLTNKPDVVTSQIVKAARDGAIGCLHDTHLSTVKGALKAIDVLQKEGYEFVTINELFYRKGLTLENAKLYKNAYNAESTSKALKAPEIKCTEDPVTGKQKVEISGDERGSIYYTTDGTAPTPINGKLYTGAFILASSASVRAVSVVNWNGIRSPLSAFDVEAIPRAILFSAPDEEYLAYSSPAKGAVIHYTDDGSIPNENSAVYSGKIEAAPGKTYRAIASAPSYQPSDIDYITYSDNGFWMRDVSPEMWFYQNIDAAASLGILNGTGDYFFRPENTSSRAMAITMLFRLASPEDVFERTAPSDTPDDKYYFDAVCWAYYTGIEQNSEDGFRPDDPITKEELAVMLARYLAPGDENADDLELLDGFIDSSDVSEWARSEVASALRLGIIKGTSSGKLKPLKTATRAETVTMILRACETSGVN